MAPFSDSPFAALTIVVAPAILTNASSVLCMGTTNRLARVVDRTRVVSAELAHVAPNAEKFMARQRQLDPCSPGAEILLHVIGIVRRGCTDLALWVSVYGCRPAPRLHFHCCPRAPFGHGGRRRPCFRMHHNDAGDTSGYPEPCRRSRVNGSPRRDSLMATHGGISIRIESTTDRVPDIRSGLLNRHPAEERA